MFKTWLDIMPPVIATPSTATTTKSGRVNVTHLASSADEVVLNICTKSIKCLHCNAKNLVRPLSTSRYIREPSMGLYDTRFIKEPCQPYKVPIPPPHTIAYPTRKLTSKHRDTLRRQLLDSGSSPSTPHIIARKRHERLSRWLPQTPSKGLRPPWKTPSTK